jgi:transcriptional regulator with XRE-family HTH domain
LIPTPSCAAGRTNLRISVRHLADTLGVAVTVIARLEDDANHDDLPLSFVVRLADALAVDIHHFILTPPTQPVSREDGATVGALLAETDVLTPIETLAAALQWDLTRTEAALTQLADDAPKVGLKLHRLRGQVRFVPDQAAASRDEVGQLIRVHDARTGMTVGQARTLKAIVDGATELLSSVVDEVP